MPLEPPARSTEQCRACGGPLVWLLRARDFNRALSRESFDYQRCARCLSVFIDEIPPDLGRYYPREYYQVPKSYADFRKGLGSERYRLELLLPFQRSGRLLEIGPGNGVFTELALEAGFAVEAIEYDRECCEFLEREQKIRAICTDAPHQAELPTDSYDVVALWHSLEHLLDPVACLDAAARWLRPGGVLLIAAPNPESFQFRLLGRWWPHLDAPRHLNFFAAGALGRLLEDRGLRRVLLTTSDPGGRYWNRFGWEFAVANWLRDRQGGRRGWHGVLARGGRLLGRALRLYEGVGLNGATYTCVFRRGDSPPAPATGEREPR